MKTKLWFFAISALILCSLLIMDTLAVFESNATGTVSTNVGKFNIKLNNYNIGEGLHKSFSVDTFNYDDSNNTENGYIAPGRSGYIDVVLDASDTDVSFRYDISFDLNSTYADNINFTVQDITVGSTSSSSDNTYYGIIDLDDIESNPLVTLRITATWINNQIYDENDTTIGSIPDNKLSIPVDVHVIQYMGE